MRLYSRYGYSSSLCIFVLLSQRFYFLIHSSMVTYFYLDSSALCHYVYYLLDDPTVYG